MPNFLICVKFVCAFYKVLTFASLSPEPLPQAWKNNEKNKNHLSPETRKDLQIHESERSPVAGNSISCTHPLDIPGTEQKSETIAKPSNSRRPHSNPEDPPKNRGRWGPRRDGDYFLGHPGGQTTNKDVTQCVAQRDLAIGTPKNIIYDILPWILMPAGGTEEGPFG